MKTNSITKGSTTNQHSSPKNSSPEDTNYFSLTPSFNEELFSSRTTDLMKQLVEAEAWLTDTSNPHVPFPKFGDTNEFSELTDEELNALLDKLQIKNTETKDTKDTKVETKKRVRFEETNLVEERTYDPKKPIYAPYESIQETGIIFAKKTIETKAPPKVSGLSQLFGKTSHSK